MAVVRRIILNLRFLLFDNGKFPIKVEIKDVLENIYISVDSAVKLVEGVKLNAVMLVMLE